MENNPIDTSAFTHFLVFESLGHETPYQIFEPAGFKEIAYSLKQKTDAFARDYSYIANGEKALRFNNNTGELGPAQQVVNPQGKVSQFLDNGLAWILESRKQKGFESKIKYILKKNGVFFDAGYLSCIAPDTDGHTYFACNVIQDGRIGNYRRQEDTVINILGTKNFRNQTITKAPILKFLRKAVPFYQKSKLVTPENFNTSATFFGQDAVFFNPISNMILDEVSTTIAPYETSVYMPNDVSDAERRAVVDKFRIMTATRRQTNIIFNLKNLHFFANQTPGFASTNIVVAYGNTPISDWTRIDMVDSNDNNLNVDGDFQVVIPSLEIGQKVWFFFLQSCTAAESGTPVANFTAGITSSAELEISASSTALDTVIYGVRYIDVARQCSKFIENIPVNAPRFDVGGEFYDQVCWNRSLVSQNTTIPFVTTFGDCFGNVQEVCGDFENKIDEIFIGQFPDFYKNVEIGKFEIKASEDTKEPWNERALINSFKIGFDKFQDDSNLSQNTLEDVHTEAEWIIPNEMAVNSLERKFKYIRSGFSQQKGVDLEIQKPTTADSTDDDVYISDLVLLPTGSSNGFGAILSLQIIDGFLRILNRSSEVEEESVVINWEVLGFVTGSTFEIVDGANIGIYNVTEITRTTVTLDPVGFVPSESGDLYVEVKYYYSGVEYQTRTNEGFGIIEGVSNPSNYPNLAFTLRRCMFFWESLLNTACSFVRDQKIVNSYFKSNGNLKSKFLDGPVYIENEMDPENPESDGIEVESLQPRIIGAKIYEIECFCTYDEAVQFLENYKTNRGFIRAFDSENNVIKGFVKNFEFFFATDRVVFTIEEKFEEKTLLLTYAEGILTVNGTEYNVKGISEWWELDNGYFKAYDADNIPLCEWKFYDEVSLDGIIYNSADELLIALTNLS